MKPIFIFVAIILGVLFPFAHVFSYLIRYLVIAMLFFVFLDMEFNRKSLKKVHIQILAFNLLLPGLVFFIFQRFDPTLALVAFIIAILNATIGEYLVDKTGFTHGILGFVVDAAVIMLASMFLEGFKVKGFLWALGLALILSILNGIMYNVATDIF